ncbi:MAG TPA: MFS transporter [Pseudonocardiaceae bacterium]
MTLTVRGVDRRFMAYSGVTDMMPIYGVYAVLFTDTGVSAAGIASLFAIWSLTSLLLEVPSGALADVVSRRLLLAVAALLKAVGFGLWTLTPGYWAFAVGFMLWGASGALTSGTLEALVHDELASIGAEEQYLRLSSRAETAGLTLCALGTAAGAPLVALGGYPATGAASVLICLGLAGIALSFPARPRVTEVDGPTGIRAWLAMLRAGLAEASGVRAVRRLVVLCALLPGMTALDEFFPLVAWSAGATAAMVPVFVLLPMLGQILGGASAGWQRSGTAVGVIVIAGGLLIVGGAVSGSLWWGFVAIALGYGAVQHAMVVSDARLQAAVRGRARATVTSVAGLGSEVFAIGLYWVWALAVPPYGQGGAVAVVAAPLVALGVLVIAWMRASDPARAQAPAVG